MDQAPSTSTLIDPASIPSAPGPTSALAVPSRAFAGEPLPRQVVWAAVVLAAVLPAILLITLILCVVSANFNFFSWME